MRTEEFKIITLFVLLSAEKGDNIPCGSVTLRNIYITIYISKPIKLSELK